MSPFQSSGKRQLLCPGIHSKKRLKFLTDLKEVYLPISIHPELKPFLCLFNGEQKDPPVQSFLLWPFFSTPGFQQGVCFGVRVGTSQRHSSAPYLDNWLIIADSAPFGALLFAPTIVPRLGDCHQLGEVKSRANSKGSVSQDGTGHCLTEGIPY